MMMDKSEIYVETYDTPEEFEAALRAICREK